MNFENWQDLWQKQPCVASPSGQDVAQLTERVKAGARSFDRTILWRDLREVIAAVGVAAVFSFVGWAKLSEGAPAWDAFAATLLPIGVAMFLLVDRQRAKRLRPKREGTVISELDHAIAELEHQHWLLTHVQWWYLLPLSVGAVLVFAHAVFMPSQLWWVRLVLALMMLGILAGTNAIFYRLNQRVARNELWPRIEELRRHRAAFAEAASG